MTGSVASVKGFPGFGVYSASNAALRSFARTWLNELKGRNIRLNLLSPGADGHIGFPTSRQGDEGDVRIPDPEGKDGSSCTQLMRTGQLTH
jgi:NAD(P)-dependent dehydrogenase (short-subunit alcohol dehydrogenase family)